MLSPLLHALLRAFDTDGRVFTLEIACKSTLIFLITGVLLVFLRRASAAARALAWRLALVALLLLPCLSLCLPALRFAVQWRVPAAPAQTTLVTPEPARSAVLPAADVLPPVGRASETFSADAEPQSAAASAPIRALSPGSLFVQKMQSHPAAIVLLMWAMGACLLLGRSAAGIAALRLLEKRARPAPPDLTTAAQGLARDYGISRSIRILTASDTSASLAPLTWGGLRPCILLPSDTAEWPAERRRAVLLHELAHVARGDWPVWMLGDAAVALYWFHPLVWLLKRQLRRECEQACDDRALASGMKPSEYASHLLEIVRMKRSRRLLPIAAISMAQPSLLETRLRALLQPGRSRRPVSRVAALLAAGALLALLSPISAAHVVLKPILTEFARRSESRVESGERRSAAPMNAKTPDDNPMSNPPEALLPPAYAPAKIRRSAALASSGARTETVATGALPVVIAEAPSNSPVPAGDSGADTTAKVDLNGIEWGAVKDGLQCGLRILGAQRRFAPRQRVTFECYIKNTSRREIAFSYGAHFFLEQRPVVHDAGDQGAEKKVTGVFLTGLDGAYNLNLGPGEMAAVYHPGLGLGKDQDPLPEAETGISAYPYLDDPADGAYVIEQTVLYHLISKDEVGRPAQRFHARDGAFTKPAKVETVRPDGAVHFKDAAFVLLHAGSQPLTSGSARFTIGAKETEAALQRGHIAWGRALNGLQACLRAPNDRRQYHIGDTVRMDFIVRNVGTSDIAFDHEATMDVSGTCPEVVDARGRTANTFGNPYLHSSAMAHETLKPGAMITLGQTAMRILANGARRIGHDPALGPNEREAIVYMNAAPGAYRMRHLDTLYIRNGDGGKVVLYTEFLPLDILPEAHVITWGPVSQGLQAGLSFQGGGTQFPLGEEIHAFLFVHNASRRAIDISWLGNEDKFFVPELKDETGRILKADWQNMTVEEKRMERRTLRPGATECIARPYFTIAAVTHRSLENRLGELSQGTWFVGGPGVYQMRLTAAVMNGPDSSPAAIEDAAQTGDNKTPKTKWTYLTSAAMKFAVVAR